jgi:hypothetical protein
MTGSERQSELEALGAVLDAYGADPKRWPRGAEMRFKDLMASSAEARRMVREAQALDDALNREVMLSPARHKVLSDRIVSAAMKEKTTQETSKTSVTQAAPQRKVYRDTARDAGWWQSATVLAASLLLGLFVGTSSTLGPAVSELTNAATLTSASSGNEISEIYGGDDLAEEDVL